MSMLSAQTGTKQSSIFSDLINNWFNSLKKGTELKKKTSQISGKDFAASQKQTALVGIMPQSYCRLRKCLGSQHELDILLLISGYL